MFIYLREKPKILSQEITLSLDEQMVLPNLEPELPSHLHIERVPSAPWNKKTMGFKQERDGKIWEFIADL
jgi:hypothetical protein